MIIENQQLAIDSRDSNILLSASAGTGKTYTMVRRVLSLLESGADISEFLVLAFGNDASKEMKERIENGIAQLALSDAKYFPQLKKLKIASISTIHAFALEITKTYFAVSGASPACQILMGADEAVLKATAMEKVFLDKYETADPEFLSLVEYFIQGRKDDKLKADIFKLYNFSRNMPKGDFQRAFFEGMDSQTLQKTYLEIVKSKAKSYLESYVLPFPIHEIYTDQYNQSCEILNAIIACETLEDLNIISQITFISKKSPKKDAEDSLKLACENFYTLVREKVKDFVGKVKKETSEGLAACGFEKEYREIATKLFAVTALFEEEYSKLKLAKDYVDFTDTEHMLLAVLKDEKSREQLNAKYKYIFCDEYQDVSKIQEEILTLLSQNGNLFTVGDIKQNIYGFRACDQTVIKNRERAILHTGDGLLLPMNTNFRSHSDILEFVNSVFSASMTNPEICEYEKSSMFQPMTDFADAGGVEIAVSKKIPPKEVEKLEVYSVIADGGRPREELNAEAEAGHIVRFILRYLGKNFDFGGVVRPVKLSDFAILLRVATGNFAKTIARVLESHNLPNFIVASESELKAHPKVLFLVDFLKAVACPFDDVPLYSTLVSPFFDVPDSVLFEIRNTAKKGYFHECFFEFASTVACKYQLGKLPYEREIFPFETDADVQDETQTTESDVACDVFTLDFSPVLNDASALPTEKAVASFLHAHHKYRTLATISCADMLKTAIADNLVSEKVTLLHGEGEWEFAKELINFLSALPDTSLAYAYEKLEKAVETIKFSAKGATPNAISIMTMHKSKGLEFPFTIIAGTGTKYNEMDTRNTVIFHKDYGMAFPHRNLETRKNSNTFEKIALKHIARREMCDEELRLLYVALTRAKFKLLITGTLDCDFNIQDNLVISDSLAKLGSLEDFYNIKTHLQIILASLAKTKYACNYKISRILPQDDEILPETVDFDSESTVATEFASRLAFIETADKKWDVIPSKFTATQRLENLSRQRINSENTDGELDTLEKYEVAKIVDYALKRKEKSENSQEQTQPASAEIGTSYHKILEEVPFFETREKIAEFVLAMIESGEILDFDYDIQKIFKLTNNPIFQGLTLHREVPFVMQSESSLMGFDSEAPILCQGIIDCVFQKENGKLILVDYKATKINSHEVLRKKYHPQLETYKIACEKILRKEVEKCYIYSIFSEDLIEVDC